MKMHTFVSAIFLSISLVFFHFLEAVVVGSDSSVSRQGFAFFPQADTDNEIRGFAFMENGFALQNSATNMLFNALFPVRGPIYLNSGVVLLSQNLFIDAISTFTSLGSIVGNNYSLEFLRPTSQIGQFGNGPFYLGNVNLAFNNDIILDAQMTFSGINVLDGRDNNLVFTSNGSILVQPGSQLTIKNGTLQGVSGTQLLCADDSASLHLENISIVLDGLYTFSQGSITYNDFVTFLGTGTFLYDSKQTSTLNASSKLHITTDVCLNIGKNTITGANPLYFVDSTSMLFLDNCDLFVHYPGFNCLRGTIFIDKDVQIDMSSTSTSTGFVMGDGVNASNDATLYYSPGATTIFNTGHIVYNNATPNGFQSASNISILQRNVGANLYIAKTWNLSNIVSKQTSLLVPPLQLAPTAVLGFNNVTIDFPSLVFQTTGVLTNPSAFSMIGNNFISLSKGTFLPAIVVSGANNLIIGNGKITGPIIFTGPTAQLTWDANVLVQSSISLNGGSLTLGKDLELDYGTGINGPGTINTSNNFIRIDSADGAAMWNTPLVWNGDEGGVILNSNTTLSALWTCTNDVVIDGRNYILDLDDNGSIVIAPGSSLKFQNVLLKNVNHTKIRCVDDTGKLVLQNVTWVLDDIYTFSHGAIEFTDYTSYTGTGTFVYDSTNTSTILNNTQVILNDGITFNVGASSVSGKQPFYFTDATSKITLDNCFFYIRSPGMCVTRGTFLLNRDIIIDSNSTSTSTGLIFGDGIDVQNDMHVYYSPGAITVYNTGFVTYNNLDSNRFVSASTSSQIVRNVGASMYIAQNWNLSNITSKVTSNSTSPLQFAPGVQLTYDNVIIDIPGSRFTINGTMNNAFIFNLVGDDTLSLTKGGYVLGLVVTGTNNVITGNGNIFGPIIFGGPTASVAWSASGMIFYSPALNGGTIDLSSNLDLGPGVTLTGPGAVNVGFYTLSTNMQGATWGTPLVISGTGGGVKMNSNMQLSNSWTINGNVVLNGNGHRLDLTTLGSLVVGPNSTLTLQNITLRNALGTNIGCVDNTGVIIMDNVDFECSGSVQFPYGALQFSGHNKFRGAQTFAYTSIQTSTINTNGKLFLDTNFTFSYAPVDWSPNALVFLDDTGEIELHNASLLTTSTGLNLLNGTVIVSGVSTVGSAVSASQIEIESTPNLGITFGNGNVLSDCILFISGASQLIVASGNLNYNNVDQSSLVMQNNLSSLYFATGAAFRLYQTTNMGAGVAIFAPGGVLATLSGTSLLGSVVPQGSLIQGVFLS